MTQNYKDLSSAIHDHQKGHSIKNINLRLKKIQQLPAILFTMRDLERLDLSYCQIEHLPEELGQLQQLKFLFLGYNQLTDLPQSITQLTKLRQLGIEGNKIEKLPHDLGNFKTLKTLNAKDCGLKELPESIGLLQELERLDLSENQLEKLPVGLNQLRELNFLSLEHNKIKQLSGEWGSLKNLINLYLGHNKLKELPKDLGQANKMQWLFLNNNLLTQLPHSLLECNELRVVNLMKNKFTHFPKEILNANSIQRLYLSYNKIEALPEKVSNMRSLLHVDLNHNKIQTFPQALLNKSIQELLLDYNQIKTLPTNIGKLKKLRVLSLKNNQLTALPPEISRLRQMTMLKVDNNQLEGLPDEIIQLENLRQLGLANNKMDLIPNVFFFFQQKVSFTGSKHLFNNTKEKNRFNKFAKVLNKTNVPNEIRSALWYLLLQRESIIEQQDQTFFFKATKVRDPEIFELAYEYMVKRFGTSLEEQPLQKGAEIALLGKVNLNKTKTKAWLKKNDMEYVVKPTAQTTHVVFGKNAENYEPLLGQKVVYLQEQTLHHLLNQDEESYLVHQADIGEQGLQHIKDLLCSRDDSNIQLALEMMKTGGVPKEVVNELFIASRFAKSSSVKTKARSMLLLNLSPATKTALSKNKGALANISEPNTRKRLEAFTSTGELNGEIIARFLFEHYDAAGFLYLMEVATLNEEDRRGLVGRFVNGDTLDFGLKGLTRFPKVACEWNHLQKVELDQCQFKEFPLELLEFKNLRSLNLIYNQLTDLPVELAQLQSLETLKLALNKIQFFPKVLYQLKNLKTLHIEANEMVDAPLRGEIIKQLPKLTDYQF